LDSLKDGDRKVLVWGRASYLEAELMKIYGPDFKG